MSVTAGFTYQAKNDLMTTYAGHTLKIALYLQANASLDPSTTTVYTSTGEVSSLGTNYTAGGQTLVGATVVQVGAQFGLSFTNPAWANSTITANACIIYDTSNANHVLGIFTFPIQSSSASNFPLSLAANGIILAI